MKRAVLVVLSIFSLLALMLTSCYWRPDFSSGGLRVDVSGIAARLGESGDVIRVYLIADGLLFSAGSGTPFMAEVPASGDYNQEQKINISGLPAGPKYKVMVGLGQVDPGNGVFTPYYYGESKQFLVTPNADTAVPMQITYLPYSGNYISFSPDLLGRKLIGIVEDSSSVFAAEASHLYYTSAYFDTFSTYTYTWNLQDSYDLAADPYEEGVSSYLSNGLSKGYLYSYAYLDTNNGILPFSGGDGWSFNKDFTGALGGSRDIKESGSFVVPPAYTDYVVFFRRDGGLGGTYVPSADSSSPTAWKWVNLNVAGVSDMALGDYNAYYAAGGVAFALPPAFLQDATPDLAGRRLNLPAPAPVQSLGFRPSMGTLTLGTTDGVWQVGVSESETAPIVSVISGPTQVLETAGDSIERIAISSYDSNSEAYLSRYYLYIRNNFGLVDKIPFFAVVPGRATGMAWDSDGTLYISGTEGLSAVYVGYSIC